MSKKALTEFCKTYTQYINKNRMNKTADLAAARTEIAKVNKQIHNIVEAVKNGFGDFGIMKAEMTALEKRKIILTEQLETTEEPNTLLHPSMAKRYQEKLTDLYSILTTEDKKTRAAETIRALIEKVIITPKGDKFYITIVGDLAQMITFASNDNPASANLIKSMTYEIAQGGVSNGCGGGN